MRRRVRCRMCGELTARPREVYATAAIAPGVDLPGARTQVWKVCEPCASLLDDGDEDDDGYF